jgi:hypothetical protein
LTVNALLVTVRAGRAPLPEPLETALLVDVDDEAPLPPSPLCRRVFRTEATESVCVGGVGSVV